MRAGALQEIDQIHGTWQIRCYIVCIEGWRTVPRKPATACLFNLLTRSFGRLSHRWACRDLCNKARQLGISVSEDARPHNSERYTTSDILGKHQTIGLRPRRA